MKSIWINSNARCGGTWLTQCVAEAYGCQIQNEPQEAVHPEILHATMPENSEQFRASLGRLAHAVQGDCTITKTLHLAGMTPHLKVPTIIPNRYFAHTYQSHFNWEKLNQAKINWTQRIIDSGATKKYLNPELKSIHQKILSALPIAYAGPFIEWLNHTFSSFKYANQGNVLVVLNNQIEDYIPNIEQFMALFANAHPQNLEQIMKKNREINQNWRPESERDVVHDSTHQLCEAILKLIQPYRNQEHVQSCLDILLPSH